MMETGGASGGGTVNIFYNSGTISNLKYSAAGGQAHGDNMSCGENGGNGTVTVGSIASGTFVKDNL